jgi:hypothetical protein
MKDSKVSNEFYRFRDIGKEIKTFDKNIFSSRGDIKYTFGS